MQTLIMEEYEYAIPRKTGMAERLRLKFSGGGTAPAVPKPPLTSEAAGKVNADITSDGRRRWFWFHYSYWWVWSN